MTAAEHNGRLWVPGVWTLTDLIERTGEVRASDDDVRRIVGYIETELIVLGASDLWTPHLLHAEVHVGDRVIRILPVFTSTQRVVEAIEMNPAWGVFSLLLLTGSEVLAYLEPGEWLGIDIYSAGEFKLPPAA